MNASRMRMHGAGLGFGLAGIVTAAVAAQAPAPAPTGPAGFAATSPLKFRVQDIATNFGVGYAVVPGDVDGDKQTDILAISGTELVWFKAPTWERRTILGPGATVADNVTLAPH